MFQGTLSVRNLTVQQINMASFFTTGDVKVVFRYSDSINRTYVQSTILMEVKARSLRL
jgi:hypothetical protein